MASIDQRIVQMRFSGEQFQAGIKGAQIALEMLKKNLNLDSAKQSIENLDQAGKRFSLAGMAKGVETIAGKFSAMSIVAITALTNIVNKAVNAGTQIVKSLTIDPVMDGFREYELKMGSIQTILANTSRHGTGLEEVTANLDELNLYADKTIYNFGDMTRNIGLFTNAGIKIGDATSMIKGFSNEAAASGTSAEGASGAAYQLSQALSSGTIRLMDWKSLSNVGMGNKNMQNGLIELAEAMGTFEGTSMTAQGAAEDFNGSLEKEWLSADVMQNYLKIQAGELSDEQMKTIGLTGEQMTAFKKQQVIAEEAATKVRTWTQLLGTMQEGVGSGWSETFDILIGDFTEATDLWTSVNNALGPLISSSAEARNKMLTEWDALGGRTAGIEAIKNVFQALMGFIGPISSAFREIFPPTTGAQLYAITDAIRTFTASLKMGAESSENLKRTFKGVFAVIDIGWMIIKGLIGVLFDLFGTVSKGGGSFLEVTAYIGDFLVAIRDAIKNGDGLKTFFTILGNVIKVPLTALGLFVGAIKTFVSGMDGLSLEGFKSSLDAIKDKADPVARVGEKLARGWENFVNVVKAVAEFFAPLGSIISNTVKTIGDAIKNAMSETDFNGVMDLLNIGVLTGIGFLIKKIVDILKGGDLDVTGGFLDSIKGAFGGLTDTLGAMQAQLKAGTLLKIAGAIALLTVSVIALSMIDSDKLTKALVAITVMFTQLAVVMAIFGKIAMGPGIVQLPILAAALILLGTAILILTAAVTVLSRLDWNELSKGLIGVTVLLGALVGAAKLMKGQGPGMIATGLGLMALAVAIRILVGAVQGLSEMSVKELIKGLGSVGILLGMLAGFTKVIGNPAGIIRTALAMAILGGALHILAGAVEKFGGISWDVLGRGLAGMAGALVAIGVAMRVMPKGMVMQAAALVIVSAALQILVDALTKMTGLSWEEIGRVAVILAGSLLIIAGAMALMTGALPGSVALVIVAAALNVMADAFLKMSEMSWDDIGRAAVILAGSLLIIAGGMYLMTGALPGAAALLVVAAALTVLTPVLQALGNMSWDEILHGLAALAGIFVVIGLAGLVLAPIVPVLLGLGVALALIGAGVALAGLGIMALALGLTALSVAGAAGAAALVGIVSAMISLIPMLLTTLAESLVLVATIIGENAPTIVAAIVALVLALLDGVVAIAPKLGEAFVALVSMLLTALIEIIPQLVETVVLVITELLTALQTTFPLVVETIAMIAKSLMLAILNTIQTMIPEIVNVFTVMVSSFLNSITTLTPQIINVFVVLITSLLQAVQRLAPEISATFVAIVRSFLTAINTLAPEIVQTMVNLIKLLVNTIVNMVHFFVDAGMRLILGILDGIGRNIGRIVESGLNIITQFMDGISRGIPALVQAGFNMIITFIESLANTIRSNSPRMDAAGRDLAGSIIEGMVNGIRNGINSVVNAARDMASNALNAAKNFLNINSPSKKFIVLGESTGEGFVVGIDNMDGDVAKSSENMGKTALTALSSSISKIGDALNSDLDSAPVIRPVLDLSALRSGTKIANDLMERNIDVKRQYESAAGVEMILNADRIADPYSSKESAAAQPSNVTFVQNNNSPKALTASELYRQTRNQLARIKEVVPV